MNRHVELYSTPGFSRTNSRFSGLGIPINRPPSPIWPLAKSPMAEQSDQRSCLSSGAPVFDSENLDLEQGLVGTDQRRIDRQRVGSDH